MCLLSYNGHLNHAVASCESTFFVPSGEDHAAVFSCTPGSNTRRAVCGSVDSVYMDVGTRSCLRLPRLVCRSVPMRLSATTRGTCSHLRHSALLPVSRAIVATNDTNILHNGLLRLYGNTMCGSSRRIVPMRRYGVRTLLRAIRRLGKRRTVVYCGFGRSGAQLLRTLGTARLAMGMCRNGRRRSR